VFSAVLADMMEVRGFFVGQGRMICGLEGLSLEKKSQGRSPNPALFLGGTWKSLPRLKT
jgi:hypothetical protein